MKILLILLISFSNCLIYNQTTGPTTGLMLTINRFPGQFNPNNDVKSTKNATGCLYNFSYLFTWGNASAGSLALENKIQRISTIDHYTANSFSGVYNVYCTTIYGE